MSEETLADWSSANDRDVLAQPTGFFPYMELNSQREPDRKESKKAADGPEDQPLAHARPVREIDGGNDSHHRHHPCRGGLAHRQLAISHCLTLIAAGEMKNVDPKQRSERNGNRDDLRVDTVAQRGPEQRGNAADEDRQAISDAEKTDNDR